LSAAEWRLLVITFVGGLGSLIAAAWIIAGAIAIARHVRNGGALWIWAADTAFGLVGLVVLVAIVRTRGWPGAGCQTANTFLPA
jgi:hypothetical protein